MTHPARTEWVVDSQACEFLNRFSGMHDAVRWVHEQLPAMEAALEALVVHNSFTGNPDGGRAVGRVLDQVFLMPGVTAEVVASSRYADHRVYRSEGRVGAAPVALLGHLDTVFPPGVFEGYRVDGALRRGPGVLDMKGGLVVIAWALKALASTCGLGAVPPLSVVIVADEEVGSPEGAPLISRVITGSQAALVFESGRANDAIVTQRKGTGALTVRATGKASHAGNAYWEGRNAIWALARFIDRAQQLSDRTKGVTVNAGLVSGGTSKNTVPAAAVAEFDLRFPTKEAEAALLTELEEASQLHFVLGATLTLERGPMRSPIKKLAGTDALLASYARCAHAHGLGADEAPLQGGGSDGNTSAGLGIPTIDALGPRGRFFHTPDEYIELDSLVPRTAALIDWLLAA
jgi:glutamate carboxypeptidase